ncbi:MAG TPA: sugar phosphate isomerase/epimerase family protein [Bryobacteraceae bacterium]|jgi:sugar phosphate isomerase/epimerase|nr:sugar phosphate isomerase/epimerase family protein [Bryobacteraceae bacterium]
MKRPLRFAACNEIFGRRTLAESCRILRETGYTGIEIAPFTLAPDPTTLDASERAAVRDTIAAHDLEFVGLHWILAAPAGLHATSADKEQRERTWRALDAFLDLSADLNAKPEHSTVIVFGSPKQRGTMPGVTPEQAREMMRDGLARLAPHAEERNVQILLEPLSKAQCDVVNTLAEAVAIVSEIGSAAIQTMFDVHNAADETLAHTELLRRYWPHIRHIHVNEMDGREPGQGDYDFAPLLSTLEALDYHRWVSLEAFDFSRDPREVVAGAFTHLTQLQLL